MRIGTDIVHIPRLAAQIDQLGPALLDRVFTADEQRDCTGRAQSLAARWAAKEAVIKACGWQLQNIDLTHIEVVNEGRPAVVLHGLDAQVLDVSLAHDGEYAIAVVLVG